MVSVNRYRRGGGARTELITRVRYSAGGTFRATERRVRIDRIGDKNVYAWREMATRRNGFPSVWELRFVLAVEVVARNGSGTTRRRRADRCVERRARTAFAVSQHQQAYPRRYTIVCVERIAMRLISVKRNRSPVRACVRYSRR
jgi:hypothetical protein